MGRRLSAGGGGGGRFTTSRGGRGGRGAGGRDAPRSEARGVLRSRREEMKNVSGRCGREGTRGEVRAEWQEGRKAFSLKDMYNAEQPAGTWR